MTPGRGGARLVRVALFSLTAVLLASLAHQAAGGAVSMAVGLTAVPVVMLVVNPLAGRRRGFTPLLATMSLLQAALHYVFMTASQASNCHVAPVHHVARPVSGITMQCLPEMTHGAMTLAAPGPSLRMTLTHAFAGVLLVLMLARGEAAVWALAAAFGFRFVLMVWTPLVLAGRLSRVEGNQPVRPPRTAIANPVLRRGPPARVRPAF